MTDIVLYSSISILLRHYQISFLLQQMEIIQRRRATHYIQRVGDLGTLRHKCLHQIPLLRAQKRRWKNCRSQRGWRIPGEKSLLNQHDQSSYELTETEAACTGSVPGLLCTYHGFQLSVFMRLLSVTTDSCAFSSICFFYLSRM